MKDRKPLYTRRDLLDARGMREHRLPERAPNVGNFIDGRTVAALAYVFRQFEKLNVKRNVDAGR